MKQVSNFGIAEQEGYNHSKWFKDKHYRYPIGKEGE
jgi:hypothetical protein